MKPHLTIKDIINPNFVTISAHLKFSQAAQLASSNQISDLMVVDEQQNFVGVVSEGDLIRAVLPDVEELVQSANGNLSKAFANFLLLGKKHADETVERLIIREPITLSLDDELLKAAIVMATLKIGRLPVVENGKLVATVSRADICLALLAH